MSLSTPINQLQNNNNLSTSLSSPLSTHINTSTQQNDSNLSSSLPSSLQSPIQPNFNQQTNNNLNNTLNNDLNNELINDILNDIDNDNDNKMDDIHNMNMSTYNYTTDRSQVPDEKQYDTPDNFPKLNDDINENSVYIVDNNDDNNNNKNSFFGLFTYNYDDLLNPLLVFIIVLLLSLTQVNRFIFSLCPQFLKESGQVNIYGVLLKSFIGMLIYLLMKFFSKIILGNNNN